MTITQKTVSLQLAKFHAILTPSPKWIQGALSNEKAFCIRWYPCHQNPVGKSGFASHTKHTAEATITDLLHSWEIACNLEFCIPWCSEIQNQDLRIPLIFISIPHGAQEVLFLNQSFCTLILKQKFFFFSM